MRSEKKVIRTINISCELLRAVLFCCVFLGGLIPTGTVEVVIVLNCENNSEINEIGERTPAAIGQPFFSFSGGAEEKISEVRCDKH